MSTEELIIRHGYWGEHPKHKVERWQYEVDNNYTRLGYWEWVVDEIANEEV